MKRTGHWRVTAVCLVLGALLSAVAGQGWAFNETAVLTGNDAAMTGGAVTATTKSGSAIWYNPAGVYDIEARSLDLAGSVFVVTLYDVDDIISSQQSGKVDGSFENFTVLPRAFTLVTWLEFLRARVAIGVFESHVREISFQEQLGVGGSGVSEWVADLDEELESIHGAFALAWKLGERVKVGASFDLVVGRWSRNVLVTGANPGLQEGSASGVSSSVEDLWTGGLGFQLRGGVQWRFRPDWILGFSISTPANLVGVLEEVTLTGVAANQDNPGAFSSKVDRGFHFGFFGIEPSIARLGLGYLWGDNWIALDVVGSLPLEEPKMGIDQTFVANVKLGTIFHIAEKVRLGLGVLTDRSAEKSPRRFGDVQADLYGLNAGVDFANRTAPVPSGEGAYLALTVSGQYSFGSGDFGALKVTDTVGSGVFESVVEPTPATVQELVVHLSFKAMF